MQAALLMPMSVLSLHWEAGDQLSELGALPRTDVRQYGFYAVPSNASGALFTHVGWNRLITINSRRRVKALVGILFRMLLRLLA